MKRIIALFLLGAIFFYSASLAEQIEIEKEVRKKEILFKEVKEKIYFSSDYEYSWIKQGARKGNWRLWSGRIAYLNENLQAAYINLERHARFSITDYAFDLGSYFRLGNGYLHGEIGFGSDIDYIYKFKALAEYEHKLIDKLFFNLNSRYLHYEPQDVYILSPGAVYYFGDNYLNLSYGASFTEGRDTAHFAMMRGNFSLNKYLNAWLGASAGERLYDILALKASEQDGYILFAGTDINLYKNIKLSIAGSYSQERPSFIKRSIYFKASLKF